MEGKLIKKGEISQEEIIKGVVKASDAISTTLGPAGKSVAIMSMIGPEITRDGATVAKSIVLSNPGENIGASLVKSAASRTEEAAGDSTSTTAILIKEFCLRGRKAISKGSNVNEIKQGMQKAGMWVNDYIRKNSTPVNDDLSLVEKVATISANNDPEIGKLVVQAMKQVGMNGLITADTAKGLYNVVEVTTGMKLNRGWASPHYVTDPASGECVLESPYILVVGERISSVNQIVSFMESVVNSGSRHSILIVCDGIDDVVSATLIYNVLKGIIKCCVVEGIDFGDNRKNVMNDLAIATGATFICPENGISISDATINHCGSAKKVVINRDSTVLYEGAGDEKEINELAGILKSRLNDASISSYDKTKFEKRLANIAGGIAIIKAGGATEVETLNKKSTIEDSILASRCAIEEGFVAGGGYIYLKASLDAQKDSAFWKTLEGDEIVGAKIVFDSLPSIMRTIAENSGKSGDVIIDAVSKSKKPNYGYNAKTRQFSDLLSDGILDSSKAIRVALENSISAASMILLIDCTIVDEPEEDKNDKCCCH